MSELQMTTLLTAQQVADMLQVEVRTISETWCRPGNTNGFPRPVMISGRMKRWKLDEIERWLEERKA